jgi:hypothetical protein
MASFEQPDVPNAILTIDDLVANAEVVRSREALHRRVVSTLSSVFHEDSTKEQLVGWALGGFRPGYTVRELMFDPPLVCSDGIKRDIAEYLNFVSTPYTIAEHFSALESCLPGIQVTYSFSSTKTKLLHVTKK